MRPQCIDIFVLIERALNLIAPFLLQKVVSFIAENRKQEAPCDLSLVELF